jgi:hypothetical protein
MSNCSVCGEPTELHVMGDPICVKCDASLTEERRMRSERLQAVTSTGSSVQSRTAA